MVEIDLGRLAVDTFATALGTQFRVSLDAGSESVSSLTLTEAKADAEDRVPFSLTFEGPADPALGQDTYFFEHVAIGKLPIFIVPIGATATTRQYQAIFN